MKISHGILGVLVLALAFSVLSCASTPVVKERSTDYDVVVIGAGMGGLSAGVHLAVNGMKVLVLEQHHKVGGCTSSFSRGEFNFDAALHEMTGGGDEGILADLLNKSGIAQKVELIRIPVLYRSILPGVDFTMPGNPDEAIEALSARWPNEKQGIKRFFKLMEKINTEAAQMGDLYRMSPAARAAAMAQAPVRQPNITKYLFTTLDKVLDDHFQDEGLKAVISQYWVYYGPPPSRMWSIMFLSATHAYLVEGAWHIKCSSQALSNAYADRIRELGGQVKTGNLVTSILVENGRATGVTTDLGQTFTARYVVSNADPFQTFFKLVGEDKTPKRYAKRIRSMKPGVSLVGVYMGLDVPPDFWNCKDHEIFFNTSMDADENYTNMMEGNYAHSACAITFYTNLGDPWYSPPGKSVLVLHAYAQAKNWPRDPTAYRKQKEEVTDQLIGMAETVLPGLREHIVVKETITPLSLEQFTMQKDGIPYGWDFTPDQGLRLTNDTPIEGLYLAGSWTNPGHGVTTAQISGYQAARLILDREGVK